MLLKENFSEEYIRDYKRIANVILYFLREQYMPLVCLRP